MRCIVDKNQDFIQLLVAYHYSNISLLQTQEMRWSQMEKNVNLKIMITCESYYFTFFTVAVWNLTEVTKELKRGIHVSF